MYSIAVEENKYHADILEMAHEEHSFDVVYCNRALKLSKNVMRRDFNFFELAFLIVKDKKKISAVYFNTLEKPQSAILALLCYFMLVPYFFTSHNFDSFKKIEHSLNCGVKKKLFRNILGGQLIRGCDYIYILTSDVYEWVCSRSGKTSSKLKLFPLANIWNLGSASKSIRHNYYVSLGAIDNARRDYDALFDFVKEMPDSHRVLLLGNSMLLDGNALILRLRQSDLLDKVVLFREYLPQQEFIRYILEAKAVLEHSKGEAYGKVKASSTSILADTLQVDLLDIRCT